MSTSMNIGKTDEELGLRVKNHLLDLGLETVVGVSQKGEAHIRLRNGVQEFLRYMGLDVTDPSLQNTPSRVADMYVDELCMGLDYSNFPKCTTTPNGVTVDDVKHVYTKGAVDEMVLVDSIRTTTLCEHHFQTIHGVTHIAYIPKKTLLGLSKFARVVNFFARRPQVQERMTEQVFAALSYILETKDVAVQVVASHGCMRHRGVMDTNSLTTTSKMGGRFMDAPALRAEFNNAIPRR